MNMLRLVETVNKNTSAVQFPLKKTVQFTTDAAASQVAASLNSYGIHAVKVDKNIVVRFMSAADVNVFAATYFPVLFEVSRNDARLNDLHIRRSFRDRLTGVRPSPHTVIVETSIQTVVQRLNAVGIDLFESAVN